MSDHNSTLPQPTETPPRWQPISPIDRRVAGVLAEKAKTTPDGYPMSLNAIRTGCNQKSNRAPVMDLRAEDVEESLERLRNLGAVGMIEGYGRVTKYRHYLYEWLAVDKVELAVMTELLLRGAQTEGELRARASRMEPITDLAALRPVMASLKSKGLVIPLTPEGRGHVVTHALYHPRELETLQAQYGRAATAGSLAPTGDVDRRPPTGELSPQMPAVQAPAPAVQAPLVGEVRREIDDLRGQLAQLRSDLETLSDHQQQTDQALRKLSDALGT
jgi:uncharacterized protein YceH (UPF0502 family)